MKIKKAALLLLALVMTFAAAAPLMAHNAYCVGNCQGAEILFNCPWTISAAQCCRQANLACGDFTGVCYGDAELFCP